MEREKTREKVKEIILKTVQKINKLHQPANKIPARNPKNCGGWEVNVPDTIKSSCGTETADVRQNRNCSATYIGLKMSSHR